MQARMVFIFVMIVFGTNGLLVAHVSMAGIDVVFYRTGFGALFLFCILLLAQNFDFYILRKDLFKVILGGLCMGMNWIFLFSAYQIIPVSMATLLCYCAPIVVILTSPIIFKEKIHFLNCFAVSVIIIGMLFITDSMLISAQKGVMCGLFSALFYALSIIVNKKINATEGLPIACYELIIAFLTVFCTIIIKEQRLPELPQGDEWLYILILGFFNTGIAYYFYFFSMKNLSGQSVAVLCYLEPLTAFLLGIFFLNEKLCVSQLIGVVLIIGGTVLNEFGNSHRYLKQSR